MFRLGNTYLPHHPSNLYEVQENRYRGKCSLGERVFNVLCKLTPLEESSNPFGGDDCEKQP